MTPVTLAVALSARLAFADYHPMVVTVLAGDAPGSSDPLTGLLTYGPLGIMVVALATGIFVPGPTHNRVVKENERMRDQIDNKVYPMMQEATAAVRESNETIKEVLRLLPAEELPPRRRRAT